MDFSANSHFGGIAEHEAADSQQASCWNPAQRPGPAAAGPPRGGPLTDRAVAVAMADGPAAGLVLVEALNAEGALADYLHFHATRADLLRRMGRRAESAVAYERALDLAANEAERAFLTRRLAEVRAAG